jgi:hypothetical protein
MKRLIGALELDDRAEGAALEATLGEVSEEALDGVEPSAGGRGEVEDKAWKTKGGWRAGGEGGCIVSVEVTRNRSGECVRTACE